MGCLIEEVKLWAGISPSLLIGPGVQVLPVRVMDTDEGKHWGVQAWGTMDCALQDMKGSEERGAWTVV